MRARLRSLWIVSLAAGCVVGARSLSALAGPDAATTKAAPAASAAPTMAAAPPTKTGSVAATASAASAATDNEDDEEHDPEILLMRSLKLHGDGKYDEAVALAERALRIVETRAGVDSVRAAHTMLRVAELYLRKGELRRAETTYQRALQIFDEKRQADVFDIGAALFNLGEIALARGDFRRAKDLFGRTRDMFEPLREDLSARLFASHAFTALGRVSLAEDDIAAAEPLLLRGVELFDEVGLRRRRFSEEPTRLLGELSLRKGDAVKAQKYLEQALVIAEEDLGQKHPVTAHALDDLCELWIATGEPERGAKLCERAASIREEALGKEHPLVARSLGLLADALVAQKKVKEALAARTRAAEIEDTNARANLATGSEEQKRAYMATLRRSTDAIVSLHARYAPEDPAAKRLALTTILRRKGRILDAMTESLAALRARMDLGDQALFEELVTVDGQISAEISRGPQPGAGALDEQKKTLERLTERRRVIEAELSARSATFRSEQPSISIEDVWGALPEGTALLELVKVRPQNPGADAKKGEAVWGAPRYYAYSIRRAARPSGSAKNAMTDADVAWADLGDAAVIDKAVIELRRDLSKPRSSPRAAAARLFSLVMKPAERILGGARTVFLSPDGALTMVPFEALIHESGEYLIDRYAFTYVTSGRDLLRMGARSPDPEEGPVVIADPAFGSLEQSGASAQSAASGKSGAGGGAAASGAKAKKKGERSIDMGDVLFTQLPGTAVEGAAIAKELKGSKLFTKEEATEAALKAARRPKILHIATHGFFLPDQPEDKSGAQASRGLLIETVSPLRVENPLLRAGLALSGANQRVSGEDDGVLTALEASALDLYGTRLVVLSACETGLGEAQSGEGVYGLRRALVMAGAETQVMSLWQVNDATTRDLMVAYYRALAAGGGRSEALRAAERAMMRGNGTGHPYYWASFIVSGDGRALDGREVAADFTKVAPSARGCACEATGGGGSERDSGGGGGFFAAIVAAYAALGRALGRAGGQAPRQAGGKARGQASRRQGGQARARRRARGVWTKGGFC